MPDLTANHINEGLKALKQNDVTFGPAEDGGYYLLGLSKMYNSVFDNKPWSETHLLEETLNELKEKQVSYTLLDQLNDIDTFEDLENSIFYKTNEVLQSKINQLINLN